MMSLVEQLAEYYRASSTAEVRHPICRWWLPQGEARLAYLRELLEPAGRSSAARR